MKNLIIILLGVITLGCQKEVDPVTDLDTNSIPAYSSFQDIMNQVQVVKTMSTQEISNLETTYGYKSFASRCDEIYDQLRNTVFSSQEEMIEAILKYPEYLELRETDSELEVVPVLGNSAFRYIMNENRMFRVENKVFKVFEDGVLATEISNINSLKSIKDLNCAKSHVNEAIELTFELETPKKVYDLKDWTYNIGAHPVERSVELNNNNRRVKLELWCKVYDIILVPEENIGFRYFALLREVTPQKQVLGIWWNYKTYLDVEYNLRYDWETAYEDWDNEIIVENYYNIYDDRFTIEEEMWTFDEINELHSHIGASDSRATTDDITNYAEIEGNTFLL